MLVLLAFSAAVMSGTPARALRRLSGAVLTVSGAYLVTYWLPVLLGTPHGHRLARVGGRRDPLDAQDVVESDPPGPGQQQPGQAGRYRQLQLGAGQRCLRRCD
ncbi:MAG: hypothetical protein M3P93_07005, partial [Actinomycetota bacterium]|nr:hypothetical protein [Actinomycetota bacterium]